MAHYLISGATGFIGSALCNTLHNQGHEVTLWTRQKALLSQSRPGWRYLHDLSRLDEGPKVDGIVNLAGEPLNAKRWNHNVKQRLVASRVETTKTLVAWARQHAQQAGNSLPVLVSGSAIGWYGDQGDTPLTESSTAKPGFTHGLCHQWEQAALAGNDCIERVVIVRTGIVLEADGGPLAEMLTPFKFGLGGPMGSGEQVWSWIHRQDLVAMIIFALEHPQLQGILNGTAPTPCKQREFATTLGKVLKRPARVPMPGFAARAVLGEFADQILLTGQAVYPEQPRQQGFEFQYPELEMALSAILRPQ